eukprot:6172266-Pleurochrysis_carterae.AAC.4
MRVWRGSPHASAASPASTATHAHAHAHDTAHVRAAFHTHAPSHANAHESTPTLSRRSCRLQVRLLLSPGDTSGCGIDGLMSKSESNSLPLQPLTTLHDDLTLEQVRSDDAF